MSEHENTPTGLGGGGQRNEGVKANSLTPMVPQPDPSGKSNGGTSAVSKKIVAFPGTAIQVNDRQLPQLTDAALQALERTNGADPRYFLFGGFLVRLVTQKGHMQSQSLSPAALRGVLARVAHWFRLNEESGKTKAAFPPNEVVQDILALPADVLGQSIPLLDRLVTIPAAVRNSTGMPVIMTVPGYHADHALYYAPTTDLQGLTLADHPTVDQIGAAKTLLLDELLGDFPFSGDADRAHLVCRILLPFVRSLVDGPTPIHAIDAPEAGTGKGLSNDVSAIVTTGSAASTIPEGGSDEEYRKKITSALLRNLPEITIDNVNQKVASGALAAAITSPLWQDRYLKTNELSELPNLATWVMTGNNIQFSHENARRTVQIRLDAKQANPENRTGFRHPKLGQWAKVHRRELVAAVLTLVQAWIDTGAPEGTETLGSFEDWAGVMGGILDVAGIPGFLANRDAMYAMADGESAQWQEFVSAWAGRYQDHLVTVSDLWDLAEKHALLATVTGNGNEKSQRTKLGIAMASKKETHFGAYVIHYVGTDSRGARQQYRLVKDVAPAPSDDTDTEAF